MSGSRWMITPLWLSGSWRSFLYSSSVYSYNLFLIFSASVRSIPFLSFIMPIFAWNVPLVSLIFLKRSLVFHVAQWVKNLPAGAARDTDVGSISESGRCPWRRKWQLIPVLLPGESCGQRSLVGSVVRGVQKNQTQLKWRIMHAQSVNQVQGKERYSQANMKSMCYSQVFTDRSNKGHNPGKGK